ncbi:MAG: glycosyltransferase family 2 protein [Prevotellaceae bacterium]|nr:glycosyltransferase family 2 protein [Prevotellaceae bacterium]
MRTAIVILNWNGKAFLEKFLHKVVESLSGIDAEVIVADNASSDGSVEMLREKFPEIRLILFDRNYGFTGGYNRAFAEITAEYFLLLNSDVEVTDRWLQPLISHLDSHPNTAACAPKLLSYHRRNYFEYAGAAGGFIDGYGYPFCRGRILNTTECDTGQYDTPKYVFWATGAALMLRADLYRKAGGLNELFFAHMEEIDLCWRLQRMGYRIANIPASTVYHVGGGALPVDSPRKLYFNYRNNLMMLANNLPAHRLYTIFIRLILDGISAIAYLLSGRFSYFAAVIKAHYGFFARIPKCIQKRRKFKSLAIQSANTGVYRGSIVLKFFISKKSLKFSDLDTTIAETITQ